MKQQNKAAAVIAAKWAAGLAIGSFLGPIFFKLVNGAELTGNFIAMKLITGIGQFPIVFLILWVWGVLSKKDPVTGSAVGSQEKNAPTVSSTDGDHVGQKARVNRGSVDENSVYASVAEELESGCIDKGAWARIFAECDGEESKVKTRYIKWRADSIIALKRERLHSTAADEAIWSAALSEFEGSGRNRGLWSRMLCEADGNEYKAKAAYLKESVQIIKSTSGDVATDLEGKIVVDASIHQENIGKPEIEQETRESRVGISIYKYLQHLKVQEVVVAAVFAISIIAIFESFEKPKTLEAPSSDKHTVNALKPPLAISVKQQRKSYDCRLLWNMQEFVLEQDAVPGTYEVDVNHQRSGNSNAILIQIVIPDKLYDDFREWDKDNKFDTNSHTALMMLVNRHQNKINELCHSN